MPPLLACALVRVCFSMIAGCHHRSVKKEMMKGAGKRPDGPLLTEGFIKYRARHHADLKREQL